MSKAYKAMVESFDWKTLTVLYQDDLSLIRLQELLMSPLDSDAKIVLRKLDFSEGADNGKILSEVKHSGAMHMLLDCDLDKIREVLSKAEEVGLVTAYHSFLITSLDLHLVDLENFKESGVNITALRLVDPRSPNMIAAFKAEKRVCANCKQTHDSTLGLLESFNFRAGSNFGTNTRKEIISSRFSYTFLNKQPTVCFLVPPLDSGRPDVRCCPLVCQSSPPP